MRQYQSAFWREMLTLARHCSSMLSIAGGSLEETSELVQPMFFCEVPKTGEKERRWG